MSFTEWLAERVRILDGGFATELEKDGKCIQSKTFKVFWSSALLLEDKQSVVDAHKRFLKAGARVIETNTYQANLINMRRHYSIQNDETDTRAVDFLCCGASLARQAIKEWRNESGSTEQVFVAGSIGPYGTTYSDGSEYHGRYVDTEDREKIIQYHIDQARILMGTHEIDVLAFETVPALAEAECIVEALHRLRASHGQLPPVWISFSCQSSHTLLNHGEPFSVAYALCARADDVSLIGINCTDIHNIQRLLDSIVVGGNTKPLVIYPNAGNEYDSGKSSWSKPSDQHQTDFKSYVSLWTVNANVRLIGGCCQISSEHIAELAGMFR